MGPQKHKDHISDAFDGFWQSGSISIHKLNTPKIKTSEDENWDSFWGRGNYEKKVNYQSPPKTQQVHYKVPTQRERLAELRAQYAAQKIQAQINLMNSQQFHENVKNFRESGREAYNIARGAYRTAEPSIKKAASGISNLIHKATERPVKQEPVGLAGALHKYSKKPSIYK